MTASTEILAYLPDGRRAVPDGRRALAGEQARRTAAAAVLLAVTIVWGSSFVLTKGMLARVPVADFLALRFGLAALALYLIAPRAARRLPRAARAQSVVLGVGYGLAQLMQTWGLDHTSASVSGFVPRSTGGAVKL